MQSNRDQQADILWSMRNHLTVVKLAVAHLRDKHSQVADVEFLCRHAATAVIRLTEEIARLEALLSQPKGDDGSRQTRLLPPYAVSARDYPQETGPLTLPPPTTYGPTS